MEHWNKFKSDNGTIEFANMEQWNKSLEQVENNISSFKSKKDTGLLSNIINTLIKLYNELTDKIKYSFVKLDNIERLKSVINAVYIEANKYYKKINSKDRKELLDKINLLRFEINLFEEKFDIHYKIENILHCISNNPDSSGAKDIEDKMHKLSEHILKTHSNNSYDEFCNIIKKWIYIVDFINNNQLCDLNKINDYDTYLFREHQKHKSDEWLLNLKQLSNYNVDIILSGDFILDLEYLNTQLYKGIVDKSISKTCVSNMFEFLSDLYIYIGENINSQDYKEIHSKIDEWMSYCINADDELELSCQNIQLNEWRNVSFFALCPKEKYSINSFSTYRYIDKLKSGISLNTLKNDTYFMSIYRSTNPNDLIGKLEELYLNDDPKFTMTMKSFVNSDYKKLKSLLGILLDRDIDFIKQNGHYQFSQTSVEALNFLLSKHFDNEDMDYNDELIDQFTSELKKGNIKRFDCSLDNDDNDNKDNENDKDDEDDPYNLYTDQFGSYIHNVIADLYGVNTNCDFSDINTALTYELLTHETYNKLVNELYLLYEDISNNHSANMASVYVTRIIQDCFSPILSMAKEIPPFFIIPENPDDVEITYDTIKSALISIKKPYNIDLIKNDSVMMKYLQRLTNNIMDLRALLDLTITKGTA